MARRWGPAGTAVLFAVLLGVAELVSGSPGWAVALFLFMLVVAVLVSPRAFPRSVTDAEARSASAGDGRPIVYWRPGCPFCMRLRARLGRDASRLHWVDIWSDPAGAATVRGVADGNETVPTVITAGRSFVNPDVRVVRELMM
jgi:glutaredoxin